MYKNGYLNNDEFYSGLLEFRNTPNNTGLSPAAIVFGKNLRSLVPAHHRYFDDKWKEIIKKLDYKLLQDKHKSAEYYNRTAKNASPISIESQVRIQNPREKVWDSVGVVVGKGKNRDYLLKLPSGKILWRNQKFVRPTAETNYDTKSEDSGKGRCSGIIVNDDEEASTARVCIRDTDRTITGRAELNSIL